MPVYAEWRWTCGLCAHDGNHASEEHPFTSRSAANADLDRHITEDHLNGETE